MSLALMNLFLFLALLQTWRFIDPIFDDILMGIIMGAGGLIFLVEGFYEKEKFNIRAPFQNSNDLVSTLTGTFAVLSSYGYITGSEFHLTHFSGVQGGILAYMLAYLLIHWLKHRFLGYTQLTIRSTKNKATKLKKSFISKLK